MRSGVTGCQRMNTTSLRALGVFGSCCLVVAVAACDDSVQLAAPNAGGADGGGGAPSFTTGGDASVPDVMETDGSAGSDDPMTLDAALSMDSGPIPLDAGLSECAPWIEPLCTDTLGTFTLEGTTPNGAATATAAAVKYYDGFTPGTGLAFYGESEGRPFVVSVSLSYETTFEPVVPPGTYAPQSQTLHWRDQNGHCQESFVKVTTVITEHDGGTPYADAGSPVDLSGTVSIVSNTWHLEGEFHILQSCGWQTVI